MRRNIIFVVVFIFSVIFFCQPFLISNKVPIPTDTIVGLYHPFRDYYSSDYPRGIPFKNFLTTDPVRQQLPWRMLAIDNLKNLKLPLWNPYSFTGVPLLGNIQSAAFYPLNFFLFLLPFEIGWSILIILQIVLSGLFFYCYIVNLRINKTAALLGSLAFSYSGFNIAWLTWNTIVHVGLWLPLILLSIDKIQVYINTKEKNRNISKNRNLIAWSILYIFSITASFLAGHLQTFFYVFLAQLVYFVLRWFQHRRSVKFLSLYVFCIILFVILTSIQWLPAMNMIMQSARGVDISWQKEDWFLPWQNLIQFIIPDFFGNPTTLNYWGIWNYGEFIGYIGILPLIMAVYAIAFRRDKKTHFYGVLLITALIFALPTFFAKIQFQLKLPLISSSQPTRLLFLVDFSLAVLCSLGLDHYMKTRKRIFFIIGFFAIIFLIITYLVFIKGAYLFGITQQNLEVSLRNTYLPFIIFISLMILLILNKYTSKKNFTLIILGMIFLTVLDLLRFANKFIPFTIRDYYYPSTRTITYLKENIGEYRFMSSDDRILPPNFSTIYKLKGVSGYDPLFLRRYGELIAATERNKPDINPPFGFNRIITPKNFESNIIDLLGVKYVLSLTDLKSEKLEKVYQEGETQIYKNKNVLQRVYFVENLLPAENNYEAIKLLLKSEDDLSESAIVEGFSNNQIGLRIDKLSIGTAKIVKYEDNSVIIETNNEGSGFLVFTDTFYNGWQALMDGKTHLTIYRTNYNFRGVVVPRGNHLIKFYIELF